MQEKISVTKKRKLLIQAIYKYQLLDSDINYIKQDLLDDCQKFDNDEVINEISMIINKQDELISWLKNNLSSNWKWERIPAIIRAVLIVGSYQIKYTNILKPIVINEMIEYTKKYVQDFDYKFINAILDKVIKL